MDAADGRWRALAAAFAVPQALLLLTGLLPNWISPDLDRSATALWLQISFTAAVILVAIRREFTRERARMLLTVGAVLVVHDLRFILDDPLSWVVGFSSVAVLLFGLTWRLLTDGEFTHADTKTLPRTTIHTEKNSSASVPTPKITTQMRHAVPRRTKSVAQ